MSDRTTSTHARQVQDRENTALAIAQERLPYHPAIGDRFGIDRASWRALVEAVFPAAKTVEGVILALSYCKARHLDPMKRPVHVVPIWDNKRRAYVETVWPGIGELRTTAMRTNLYAGCDECEFGPDETVEFSGRTGRDGQERDVRFSVTFPTWARLTVYRLSGTQRVAIPGPKVYWRETYGRLGRTELPNDMWQKRPVGQLEKCAEAGALRRAFPEEAGNDPTAEEMGGGEGVVIDHGDADAPAAAQSPPAASAGTPTPAAARRPAPPASGLRQPAPDERQDQTPAPAPRQAPTVSPTPAPAAQPVIRVFYPMDEIGEPAEEGGELLALRGPAEFARWFAAEVARAGLIEGLREHNADSIADASEDPEAARILAEALNAQTQPAQDAHSPPMEPDTQEAEAPSTIPPQPLAVPLTPGGKPHWPNYAAAAEVALAAMADLETLDAWVDLNKATYASKPIAAQINALVVARAAAIEPGDWSTIETPDDAPPAPQASAAPQDASKAFVARIKKDLGEIRTFSLMETWVKSIREDMLKLRTDSPAEFAEVEPLIQAQWEKLRPAGAPR